MMSIRSCGPCASTRTRVAALFMAAIAIGYSLLSVFYFYEDFFKYLGNGAAMTADRTGWLVSVDGVYLWTILSPWRLVGAALAVAMLGVSAAALWRGRPRARALSLITLWGVLFPQLLWYTEFAVDWHRGQGISEIVTIALLVAGLPTLLLSRRDQPLVDWDCISPTRLFGLAVLCCWIGFAATEFIDHSYQMASWTGYLGALAAIPLAALAVKGIFHMRAWGLWAAVAAAVAVAMIPLAATHTGYMYTGGYIDELRATVAGTDGRAALSMAIPLAAVWLLAAPYLHAFLRKLRLS